MARMPFYLACCLQCQVICYAGIGKELFDNSNKFTLKFFWNIIARFIFLAMLFPYSDTPSE